MNQNRPDVRPTTMPENPQASPEQTVDALEEKITGDGQNQHHERESLGATHTQDIDPAETTAEQGGHPASDEHPD